MGRTTLTNRHPLNVNKKELEEHYNHMAAMENWREGTRGLSESIYWKDDFVFENIHKAVIYMDDKNLDQVAVKFKDFIKYPDKTECEIKWLVRVSI